MLGKFITAVLTLSVFLSIGGVHAAVVTNYEKTKNTPFAMPLPGIVDYQNISISGVPKCYPDRMSLWLVDGSDYESDRLTAFLQVDLYFKDTPGDNEVVVGSRVNGTQSAATFTLRDDKESDFPINTVGFFNICIFVRGQTFVVRFNNDLEVEYTHEKMILQNPPYLVVLHDAFLTEVEAKSNIIS